MKKGEKPQFSASWWKGSQPKDLKSAGGLENALKGYEAAKGKLKASGSGDDADAAEKALDGVEKAAKAVISEASGSKVKANPDMQATVGCLEKFAYTPERKWLAAQVEEGMFSDPDVYKQYLKTALKRLNKMAAVPNEMDDDDEDGETAEDEGEELGKGMNFGIVLGKKAENHRMALHKSKSGKALGSMLAKETGIHKFTFGVARPSENKGEMVLELEGPQIAGMGKKGARMLKKFKPLPFTSIVMMVDGSVVKDLDDPEDTDTDDAEPLNADALTRALAELARRIQGVGDPALKGELARMATQANALLRGNNLPEASERIEQLRAALDKAGAPVNGTNGGNGATQAVGGSNPAAFTKARQAWIAARGRVIGEVEKLRAEIEAAYKSDGIDVNAAFKSRVADVVAGSLDERLSEKLNEVAGATEISQRSKLIGEARAIMAEYQTFMDGTLMGELDSNPFTPLAIRQVVTATLSALGNVVH